MNPAELDTALRQLFDPAAPWKTWGSRRATLYRAARLEDGLGVAYTPAAGDLDCHRLSLSRPADPVTDGDVQAALDALARVTRQPGLRAILTQETPTLRRLYWRTMAPIQPRPANTITVYQAVVWDRDENYEEGWMSLGITTDHQEARRWLGRDQRRHLLRGQIISYQVTLTKEAVWQPERQSSGSCTTSPC